MTGLPECRNKTLVGCEACLLWYKFLPTIRKGTAEEHEQAYFSDCPDKTKYRTPPPIPDDPCPEVETLLTMARQKHIIP